MHDMREIIIKKLDETEADEDVKILYCAESGSRAWGFASPDSDYDVRFVYLRKREFYLRLDRTRDVIDRQLDEVFDINGWDIQKTLKLLHSSNPTIFEWAGSPIVYRETEEWKKIRGILGGYFSPVTAAHHYLSMAHNHNKVYLGKETVSPKKYFYVLRQLLACKYVLENKCPPPIPFSELAEAGLDPAVKPYTDRLLELKTSTPELQKVERIVPLHRYISEMFEYLDAEIVSAKPVKRDWDELNSIFFELTDKNIG